MGTPKLGKLSQVAAQPPWAVRLQSCCQWPLDPPFAVLQRHLPPPQPIVPADLGGASPHSTAVLGVRGGGGEILTWLSLGGTLESPGREPRRCLNTQPLTAPSPALSLLSNTGSGLGLALSEHHSATRLIHIFPPFSFKVEKKLGGWGGYLNCQELLKL